MQAVPGRSGAGIYGSLVKWLRRRPLKAESGVQFSYELRKKAAGRCRLFFFLRLAMIRAHVIEYRLKWQRNKT